MNVLVKDKCTFCIYLNRNGTCGNRHSVMYNITTNKKKLNFVAIDAITTERLSKCTRRNAKYKAYMTMNKLIEVAEELYKQIDNAQVHLINARLNNDEEGKKSAISEMETAMCNAMQLLKCFIEHKDNIVDLSEMWHKYNPKQEICDAIIACCKDDILFEVHSQYSIDIFLKYNRHLEGKVYFSFVKDLLPKGGE